jgi:hypothetical protein
MPSMRAAEYSGLGKGTDYQWFGWEPPLFKRGSESAAADSRQRARSVRLRLLAAGFCSTRRVFGIHWKDREGNSGRLANSFAEPNRSPRLKAAKRQRADAARLKKPRSPCSKQGPPTGRALARVSAICSSVPSRSSEMIRKNKERVSTARMNPCPSLNLISRSFQYEDENTLQ